MFLVEVLKIEKAIYKYHKRNTFGLGDLVECPLKM